MAVLAKLSRPKLTGVHPRERLFARMDDLRRCPLIWISAPPGAGKTTLVASYLAARGLHDIWYQVDGGDEDVATFFSYLGQAAQQSRLRRKPLPLFTAEYAFGLEGFSRNFFEQLCARLPEGALLVFDNYQEASTDSRLHDVVRAGLERVPHGLNLVVVSRFPPPPVLARQHANGQMAVMDWSDLRLTDSEADAIVALRESTRSSDSHRATHWVRRTQGWVAGLVLLLEALQTQEAQPDFAADFIPEAMFDYFVSELLARETPELRAFLVKTALLPKLSAEAARALTGEEYAERILDDLRRRNFFITGYSTAKWVYQYHPLFRDFLLELGRTTIPQADLEGLQRDAAELLARDGEIVVALDLLRRNGDWRRMSALILQSAGEIFSQGRIQTLAGWLEALPEGVVREDPWLQYWRAQSLLWNDPVRSLACFESAFARFRERRDITGTYLAWCGAIEAIMCDWNGSYLRWDSWLAALDELRTEFPDVPTQEIEFKVAHAAGTALIWLRPAHPQVVFWRERLIQLTEAVKDRSTVVEVQAWVLVLELMYGTGVKARAALESLEHLLAPGTASPFASTLAAAWTALYHLSTGRIDEGRAAALGGLDIAGSTGCHIHDFHLVHYVGVAALLACDRKLAAETLSRMASMQASAATVGAYLYQQFAVNCTLSEGDYAKARTHADAYLDAADKIGMPLMRMQAAAALAVVCFELREVQQAHEYLGEALRIAREIHSLWNEWGCLCYEAYFAFCEMDEERGFTVLEQAFALGAAQGYRTTTLLFPKGLCLLCRKALERDIEVEYSRAFIKTGFLHEPRPPLDLENWPWPIKIHSLGRFEIQREEQQIRSEGKAQHKPMELLKALIALGGDEVPANKLIDILWAEPLEGDEQKAFEITVHRLRKLLGNEKAVQVSDRRVTLNPEIVWVDLWALERRLAPLIPAVHAPVPDVTELERAAPAILDLYRGHFLDGDGDLPWLVPVRNRLSGRFQRFVLRLGEHWELAHQWTRAAELYQRGVELDPLSEVFYRRLMVCLREQGERVEACEVYLRCRQMLSITLGVKPAAATEQVYRELLGS